MERLHPAKQSTWAPSATIELKTTLESSNLKISNSMCKLQQIDRPKLDPCKAQIRVFKSSTVQVRLSCSNLTQIKTFCSKRVSQKLMRILQKLTNLVLWSKTKREISSKQATLIKGKQPTQETQGEVFTLQNRCHKCIDHNLWTLFQASTHNFHLRPKRKSKTTRTKAINTSWCSKLIRLPSTQRIIYRTTSN